MCVMRMCMCCESVSSMFASGYITLRSDVNQQ